MAKEINPPVFKNELGNEYYEYCKNCNFIAECGTDSYGNIYFHYLNGVTERYTRRKFMEEAWEWKNDVDTFNQP